MELQQFVLLWFGYNVHEWLSKWGYKYSSVLSLVIAENLWTDSGPQNSDPLCLCLTIDFSNFISMLDTSSSETFYLPAAETELCFFLLGFEKAIIWLSIKCSKVVGFILIKNVGQRKNRQCLRKIHFLPFSTKAETQQKPKWPEMQPSKPNVNTLYARKANCLLRARENLLVLSDI